MINKLISSFHKWYFAPRQELVLKISICFIGFYLIWFGAQLYYYTPLLVGKNALYQPSSPGSLYLFIYGVLQIFDSVLLARLLSLGLIASGFLMLLNRISPWVFLVSFIILRSWIARSGFVNYGGNEIISILLIGMFLQGFIKTSCWPTRLLQIQLAFIYWSAVSFKLNTHEWFNGAYISQLAYNRPFFIVDLVQIFTNYPLIPLSLNYLTILIELFAPLLAFIPYTRRIAVISGIGLHVCFQIFMNVHWFNIAMIAYWILFLKDSDLQTLSRTWSGQRQSLLDKST